MEKNSVNYKYLVRSPRDIDWGITVDTVGSEPIPPNYPVYPPRTGHPDAFYFTPSRGPEKAISIPLPTLSSKSRKETS